MAENGDTRARRVIHAAREFGAVVLNAPEVDMAIFALLLNYPWELLQAPLYLGMATAPHWLAVQRCTVATIGDGVLMLFAYFVIAVCSRRRWWVLRPTRLQSYAFILIGVGVTIAVERWSISGVSGGWVYSHYMPIVPGFGVGLSPMVQWTLIPPLVLWFVRRQLSCRGSAPFGDHT